MDLIAAFQTFLSVGAAIAIIALAIWQAWGVIGIPACLIEYTSAKDRRFVLGLALAWLATGFILILLMQWAGTATA